MKYPIILLTNHRQTDPRLDLKLMCIPVIANVLQMRDFRTGCSTRQVERCAVGSDYLFGFHFLDLQMIFSVTNKHCIFVSYKSAYC